MKSNVKAATFAGVGHAVLSDLSRSTEHGPRPFTKKEYIDRCESLLIEIKKNFPKDWESRVVNVLNSAVSGEYVKRYENGKFSVTGKGRETYRDARRKLRESELDPEEKKLAAVIKLNRDVGPIKGLTKAELVDKLEAYKARHEPQRRPAPLQAWNSLSTVTDGGDDIDAEGEDDMEEDEQEQGYQVPGPSAAAPMRVWSAPLRDDPAAAYPSPASVPRPGRDQFEVQPEPATPSRGQAGPSGLQRHLSYVSEDEDDSDDSSNVTADPAEFTRERDEANLFLDAPPAEAPSTAVAELEARIIELEEEHHQTKKALEAERRLLETAVGDKQQLQMRVEEGDRKALRLYNMLNGLRIEHEELQRSLNAEVQTLRAAYERRVKALQDAQELRARLNLLHDAGVKLELMSCEQNIRALSADRDRFKRLFENAQAQLVHNAHRDVERARVQFLQTQEWQFNASQMQ